LFFVSSSVVADSFVLRNPLLRQAPSAKTLGYMLKDPPHKWHIWFFPTRKSILRKTKRAIFCQLKDKQNDKISNTFYLEKRYNQKFKTILAA